MFELDIRVGDKLSNEILTKKFKVGNSGGMGYSKANNILILVADHTKMYSDVWDGDTLYYTGMGKEGDQSLDYMQNKRLNNSNKTDIKILLFEVFNKNQYEYMGIVKLVGDPVSDIQKESTS